MKFKFPGLQIFGFKCISGFRVFGFSGFQVLTLDTGRGKVRDWSDSFSGFQAFGFSGCWDFGISGFRVFGFSGFRDSGFWVFGLSDFQLLTLDRGHVKSMTSGLQVPNPGMWYLLL